MRRLIPTLVALSLLTGCATPHNNYDPLEPVNRPIFALNRGVDKVFFRPLAVTWTTFVPSPVRSGVHNFFENIVDLFAIPAALLQGKGSDAGSSFSRVLINSTMGIGGLIDVATDLKIAKSQEDFGQALGYWGAPSGPYLMLPLMGPISTRDAIDPVVRFAIHPSQYITPESARYAYMGINATDARSQLLPIDRMLEEQYDQYAFVRDTYLQRRWFKVHDGAPPHPLPMGDDEDPPRAPTAPASEAKP